MRGYKWLYVAVVVVVSVDGLYEALPFRQCRAFFLKCRCGWAGWVVGLGRGRGGKSQRVDGTKKAPFTGLWCWLWWSGAIYALPVLLALVALA